MQLQLRGQPQNTSKIKGGGGREKKRRGREVIRPIKMARPKHLGTTTMQRCDNHKNQERNVGRKKKKTMSQQKVAIPAVCTVCGRVRLFLDIFAVSPPCSIEQSGTNVTSSFPSPREVKEGLWVVVTRIAPGAPGLRSDRGLVGHKAARLQWHWGLGSLALMVLLLLRSFTRVPFILCSNIVRCRHLVNGIKPETAFKC